MVALPAIGDSAQSQPPAPASPIGSPAESAGNAAHEAQARWEAIQERKAALTAELNRRYEDLQREAAQEGIEPLPAPPWPQEPRWLSYEEMRELMRKQGVIMPPAPDFESQPQAGAEVPAPAAAQSTSSPTAVDPQGPEALRTYFGIIEQMSPQQQEACFAVARWQAEVMASPPMPPAALLVPGGPFPPESALQSGQPFPRMMSPGH